MSQKRVLVIEDEGPLAELLGDRLLREGYSVEIVSEGTAGLQTARRGNWNLLILDIMLPGISGLEICERLRREGVTTPVLMLTARGGIHDRVAGLRTGADDYLPKPFHVAELLARMEALLRRSGPSPAEVICFGEVRVDRSARTVSRNGEPVELSFKEFQLLIYLLDRPGLPVSREELLQNVWGYPRTPNTRTVDVHMAQLRARLESSPKEPRYLVTAHGFGYKFSA